MYRGIFILRDRERKQIKREGENECVCVCVCERDREREEIEAQQTVFSSGLRITVTILRNKMRLPLLCYLFLTFQE